MKRLTKKAKKQYRRLAKCIGLIIILTSIIASFVAMYGYKEDATLAGTEEHITWIYVNMRVKPNINSAIIKELKYSEVVSLTGKTYRTSADYCSDWYEVEVDGTGMRGWIVVEAVH